jgi:hypothetical protein
VTLPIASPVSTRERARAAGDRLTLAGLVLTGAAIEALLVAGWLRPLSLWRTPTNLPAGAPMVLILEQTRAGAIRFLLPAVGLTACWFIALWLGARARGRVAPWLALACSALFLVTLLPMNPGGTQDIYHNVADGRLFWLYGVNPTLIPPQAFPEDAFAPHVWGYVDLPSAYGPLWYLLTGPPTLLAGDELVPNLVAQKALVAAFMLGTVVAATLAARAIAPERATFAAVLTGWSPLLLWESAGNGHNDSVMAFFLALSLLAAARRSYVWVLPLLTLSVLVKFTTALVGPVALIWLLRRPDVSRRQILTGIAISVALALALFAPMWAGADTVAAMRRPGMTFILSPGTLAHGALAGPLSDAAASRVVRAVTGLLFLGAYALIAVRTRGDARDLAGRGFDALFVYLVLVSWWFWPWYLTWLAPLAALCRGYVRPLAFALCASSALLTYLYWWPDPPWRTRDWFELYAAITIGVFVLPAVVWLIGLWRPVRERRSAESPVPEAG